MKMLFVLLVSIISFISDAECGDGITYANEKQTKFDKRFSEYPKIESSPSYVDGKEQLNNLIESKLQVEDQGKEMIFRLNYMFTITCSGEIKDFKVLGDAKMSKLTNIKEIISNTNGKWNPAKKNGAPVDCIYFAKKTIVGGNY